MKSAEELRDKLISHLSAFYLGELPSERLDRVLSIIDAAGWQIVPKVATAEMISAGCLYDHFGEMAGRYEAMIDAAPKVKP